MKIADSLLAEFDHEMKNTRVSLARVPDDKLDWRPHAKSFTLGQLATHIAEIPMYALTILKDTQFDINPPGGQKEARKTPTSREEILKLFDENILAARPVLQASSNEDMNVPWTLLSGGHTVFTLPRVAVMRTIVLNHNVHHRAQLGVYFRLLDIPVPSIYGPSKDEAAI